MYNYIVCDFIEPALLQVRDGGYSSSPLIGQYCGSDVPSIITSTGNQMWIRFTSDGSANYGGFLAYYAAVFEGTDYWSCRSNINTVPSQTVS